MTSNCKMRNERRQKHSEATVFQY